MNNEATQPIDDGGSAFPSHGSMGEVVHDGMSLRDWFAGQAMNMLLGGYDRDARRFKESLLHKPDPEGSSHAEMLAGDAYIIADAMIAARKARP